MRRETKRVVIYRSNVALRQSRGQEGGGGRGNRVLTGIEYLKGRLVSPLHSLEALPSTAVFALLSSTTERNDRAKHSYPTNVWSSRILITHDTTHSSDCPESTMEPASCGCATCSCSSCSSCSCCVSVVATLSDLDDLRPSGKEMDWTNNVCWRIEPLGCNHHRDGVVLIGQRNGD